MAIPVAQYLRVSYGRIQQSIEQQKVVIRNYALKHDLEVVRTYQDNGKTGLNLQKRMGLRMLLLDVGSGKADYRAILVHDVSRWGRFQDIDEGAYYEFLCKLAGVPVRYCVEGFDSEITPQRFIEKSLRRVMAAEFSRDLSEKTYRGQLRLVKMGFRVGGPPPYAFSRGVVSSKGEFRCILRRGEHKSIQTDRVVLVPGDASEIAIVRDIYDQVVRHRRNPKEIACSLNQQGLLHNGARWWCSTVDYILTNATYCGANVWNRRSSKFQGRLTPNRHDEWIVQMGAFPPIVSPELFQQAQEILSSGKKPPVVRLP